METTKHALTCATYYRKDNHRKNNPEPRPTSPLSSLPMLIDPYFLCWSVCVIILPCVDSLLPWWHGLPLWLLAWVGVHSLLLSRPPLWLCKLHLLVVHLY